MQFNPFQRKISAIIYLYSFNIGTFTELSNNVTDRPHLSWTLKILKQYLNCIFQFLINVWLPMILLKFWYIFSQTGQSLREPRSRPVVSPRITNCSTTTFNDVRLYLPWLCDSAKSFVYNASDTVMDTNCFHQPAKMIKITATDLSGHCLYCKHLVCLYSSKYCYCLEENCD